MNTRVIPVCAAVIFQGEEVLLCTRPPGSFMAGQWEFPGGKRTPQESLGECLRREIREELGLEVIPLDTIFSVTHSYPGKIVEISFIRCLISDEGAKPHPHEGQDISWIDCGDILSLSLLPADLPVAEFLAKRNIDSKEQLLFPS